ncbi:uncharacterized protein LOC107223264 [Neodiprion lecontei]|uniref:Uncharacterized protein LOC107223264 n=1 Tax=Neodiprion lecontei TaxID=441921 RepID=A0ABM3GIF9_NEOLC|nr:uncharacterized protein LOC107223264 [Neodiprion lecontei]
MSLVVTVLQTVVYAVVFVKIFKWLYEYYEFAKIIDKIPGPKAYPLIGNTLIFRKVKHDDRYEWFRGVCKQYHGGIFRTWLGTTASVHLTSPETVSAVLASRTLITKSHIYDFIHPWLGTGLLTSTGDQWHQQRKLITPTFHFNIMDEYSVVMFEKAEILKECIESELKNNPNAPIDVFDFLTRCALDIICEAAMGVNINAQTDQDAEYSTALHGITTQAVDRIFRPLLHYDWLYYHTRDGKKFKRTVETAHKFTKQVISEKKLARQNRQRHNADENGMPEKPKRQAFLDHLLDACEREKMPLTDEELREQVDTFLFAGHDTSSSSMSWALFCIGNNPDVEDKIHEEHLRIFGESKEPATLRQINELKYLERVIKETLRLFPSAPSVSRRVTEDLEIAGYKIPKNSIAGIQIHYIHRDPKHWPNPDKFDPDRFLPENSQGRHPYAYIPFSAGPRNCIGQKFSLLEQKIVLTAILREWKVKSALKYEEAKCYNDFILRPQQGIKIYFTRLSVYDPKQATVRNEDSQAANVEAEASGPYGNVMGVLVLLLTAACAIILIRICQLFHKFNRFAKIIDKIPGPKSYPIVGTALALSKVKRNDLYKWFQARCKEYEGGIFRIWIGIKADIHLSTAENVSTILPSKSLITKSETYNFIHPWLGTGLITSTGDKWNRQRKLLTPAFHFNILEEYSAAMFEKAEILKQCIESELKNCPNEPVDMFTLITRCALDIICESAMGININAQIDHSAEYSMALHKISYETIERIFRPWIHNDWFYYQLRRGKEYKNSVETAHRFTAKVISKKKMTWKSQQENNSNKYTEFEKQKRRAFLDHLLDACAREKTPLTDNELREEVDTFLFAGHDTTAAAISWGLFCIGNNPDVEEKIHQEQLRVFGDSVEPATLNQINELKYLERVVKETMRLFPPVPTVGRIMSEEINIAGYKIPKGTNITVHIHHIHRDPKHWTNPEKFDPDRFLPENSQERHPYAYVPFSAGPRNCIGQRFSLLEQKIVLTTVLRKWRIKSALKYEEAECYIELILRPQNGIKIYFTPK